jgi:PAS domain S-box-containing protein
VDVDADIYRVLFEINPRPMWVFERETRRLLLVNDAVVALYGWTREELLQMTLLDLRPPDDRLAFEHAWSGTTPAGSYARAGRHWTKTGEILDVNLEITRCTIGGRLCSLAIATNVTGIADAERRFKLLVEHSAEAIAVSSADFTVEYVSPAGERMLGVPASEMVGKRPMTRVHPDDVHRWVPPAPFETRTHAARIMHRDGTWRWIESTTTNLLREPAVRAYVTNYRDITARVEAEHRMQESQRRLEYLLSATSAVTYTAYPHGDEGVTFIGANVTSLLGYAPQDFVNTPSFWREHIHPDDVAKVEEALRVLVAKGEHSVDYRFRHADGTYRHIRDAARLRRDDAGRTIEIVGYWIDITEQSQAQEALRRSEANFRSLIERSGTAIVVQRDGRIIYANPAAAAMFGYAQAEMAGLDLLALAHPEDRELIRQRMQHTNTHGATPPGERRMVRRDGHVFYGEGEAARLDFDGVPANVVFLRDVTERREMFERMAVADRMLTVGTLAAGVAHEINNPLMYVATNLGIITSELPALLAGKPTRTPKHELPGLVADASDGVARVSAIVRDLRALAKPEDDRRGPVDVAAAIASSIKMAYNEIRHRATVVSSYAPDLPLVHANASRLGQVFLNLLMNAAQAITEGHAAANEIRIRATCDATRVIVEVEDTGAGIPPSIIKRIFDPFFTTKAPGVGMGLGLAICRQIVSTLGGDIAVDSKLGVGTTFRVMLPVAIAETHEAAAQPVAATSGARILLVDDEIAVGRSLSALLSGEHEVVPVTGAREALARLEAGEHFDVILCDLMMPEISGIELYAQIPAGKRDRIVFMTGGAFTPQAREFLATTNRPRLDKPFSEQQLRDAIERVRCVPP